MRSIARGRITLPSRPASHERQNGPALSDDKFAVLQQQVFTGLSTLYKGRNSPGVPKVVAAPPKADVTIASLSHETSQAQLAGQIGQGIATIHAFRTKRSDRPIVFRMRTPSRQVDWTLAAATRSRIPL